jgi:hypothetical protein
VIVHCATAKVRPCFEEEPVAWIASALYMHDGDEWLTVGAGATESAALVDLNDQLPDEVETLLVLSRTQVKERKALLWSAQQRALWQGAPFVQVP